MGSPHYQPPWSLYSFVEDSYSRYLDVRVLNQEMPYGYDGGEPPAAYNNHEAVEEHFKMKHKK